MQVNSEYIPLPKTNCSLFSLNNMRSGLPLNSDAEQFSLSLHVNSEYDFTENKLPIVQSQQHTFRSAIEFDRRAVVFSFTRPIIGTTVHCSYTEVTMASLLPCLYRVIKVVVAITISQPFIALYDCT